jgi:lipopolysaccharide/colanic/teichoic acid biosynthesis glycosyltransferase
LRFGKYVSSDFPIFVKQGEKKKIFYSFLKRAFDIVASLCGLLILSPLFAVVALLIKADDGGPVIYTRICEGKNGRQYKMYKFRSMQADADHMMDKFSEKQKIFYKKGGKLSDDPRVTKVGRCIRKASIDELPQLLSVLKGDMSLIGPRPVIKREADAYGDKKELLLSKKPGITGYWQINGRDDVEFLSDQAKAMQLYYVEHDGFKLDIEIFFKTIVKLIEMKEAR